MYKVVLFLFDMKLAKLIFSVLFLLNSLQLFSFSNSDSDFIFEYDYCLFRNDDNKLFLEFYYSFSQSQLKFVKSDDGFEAAGKLELQIFSKAQNKNIVEKFFKVPIQIKDTAGYNRNVKLTGQLNIVLDSGMYSFKINARDFYDTVKSFHVDENFMLSRFESKVTTSSMQLAVNIQSSSETNNVFYKNTLEVTPSPSKIFGNELSKVFYYIELYNLKTELISDQYKISVDILDPNSNKVKTVTREYKIKNESKVEYGSFDISSLQSGKYKLVFNLMDDKNTLLVSKEKEFWVYNNNSVSNIIDDAYKTSEYANYTEQQIQEEFEYASYLLTDKFQEQFKTINDIEVKKKILYEFWKKLDSNPLSIINEYKQDYIKRIVYSDANFGAMGVKGWKTDRGRIYCVYGKPTDVERFPFGADARPYEIWKHDSFEGGVIFVFIDISNQGENYILVHSTARNELQDEDWRRRLNPRK